MKRIFRTMVKWIGIVLLMSVLAYGVLIVAVRPSLSRDWMPDQAVLPHAEIHGDVVNISNIRNVKYRSTTDYDVHYYDKTFDLSKLNSVWYVVEPFSGHGAGAAHTFLSFGFEGGDYLAISVEIRKEKGESFSPLRGLLRQYEIMYVVADERDVIKLRTNFRHDKVFLYPTHTSKDNMRKLLISMLSRSNKLSEKPEFYNTLTNTCTTNIVAHVNELVPGRIPLNYKVLLPAYSDELARELGLIGDNRTIEELRSTYLINDKAALYGDDPLFSEKIRS